MMHSDVRPAAMEILALKDDEIDAFMRDLIASKRLSALVQTLNQDILEGTSELANAAQRALSRLGFVDD